MKLNIPEHRISWLVSPPIIISAILSVFAGIIIYRLFFHPLRRVPGPFLARITELWRTTKYMKGTWHNDILEVHRRYGSVARISPNEVSVVHPDLIKTVFGHSKGTMKTDWYVTWRALGGTNPHTVEDGFFNTTDPKNHAFLRRRVSAIYSMSSIVGMDSKIQPVMDSLWKRFDEYAEKGESINLSKWASYFTYDVVGTLCFSEPMGFVRDGQDSNFISIVHNSLWWIVNLGFLPGQSFLMMNPLCLSLARFLKLQVAEFSGAFQEFAVGRALQRFRDCQKEAKHQDMLDHFITLKDPQGKPASISAILAEIGNVLVAGADTTSVAIKAVLGPLLQDPKRYHRLQEELNKAVADCNLDNREKALSYSVIKDLPFLSACIKEGSRIHPSIVYQLPRIVPTEGITFDGYFLDRTITISMSPLSQNRCREVFGEDADQWKPERWIPDEGSSEEQIKLMDKNLATFGYGSRTCIGRNLATFELYKFVSQFLIRYDVELVNKETPWTLRSLWFSEPGNMMIRLTKRNVEDMR